VIVRLRHHATTRREERVELPLDFMENLRNPWRKEENMRECH